MRLQYTIIPLLTTVIRLCTCTFVLTLQTHEHYFWYGLRNMHHTEQHSITLKRRIKQRITILSGNIIYKFPSARNAYTVTAGWPSHMCVLGAAESDKRYETDKIMTLFMSLGGKKYTI
jgi:hypothetical protein